MAARSVDAAKATVLVVEDHQATRELVCSTLEQATSGRMRVVSAATSSEALGMLTKHSVSIALVDLRLLDESGVALIGQLAARKPPIPAVALTVCDDSDTVLRTLASGAVGYLLKDDPPSEWIRAIEAATEGKSLLSAGVARHVVEHLRESTPATTLSPRERDVAVAFSRGLSHAECADRLGIGVGTVQQYAKALYRKLGVRTKAEVAAWVARHRLE